MLFRHVESVILAEFDIDQGAVIKSQYPQPLPGVDTRLLAELMLPDGAHLRNEDWFTFFLNQKSALGEVPLVVTRQRKPQGDASIPQTWISAEAYVFKGTGWSLLSKSAKANVWLTEHAISVWDELNRQMLHEISTSTLEYQNLERQCLYLHFNKMILALRFLNDDDEILVLNHIEKDLELHKGFNSRLAIPPPPPFERGQPVLCVHNLVFMRQISGARRGARIMAIAITTQHQWAYIFKPLLACALDNYFDSEHPDILPDLFKAINSVDLTPMPRLLVVEKMISRSSVDPTIFEEKFEQTDKNLALRRQKGYSDQGNASIPANGDCHFFEAFTEFAGDRVPLHIPIATYPEEYGDFSVIKFVTTFSALDAINPPPSGVNWIQFKNGAPFYWHPHLDSGSLTHPIVFLLNALLTQKRVVFLGHQRAAGEVAEFVLAASSIASGGGALFGGISERCFPYASLACLDEVQAVPGFIAGVTNPMFAEQPNWWDVLCDINTGKISVSPNLDVTLSSDDQDSQRNRDLDWLRAGYWEGDNDFVVELVNAIQNGQSEMQIREKFLEHVRRFIETTATYELETIGTTGIGLSPINTGAADIGVGAFFASEIRKRKELLILKNRIEGWRKTKSYLLFQKDFQSYLRRRPLKDLDLRYLISALKNSVSLEEPTVVRIYLALQDALVKDSDDALTELLSVLPQSNGGLLPLASGLLHNRWEVRRAATRLLWRLDWHSVGTRFVQHLNPFLRLCYSRLSRDLILSSENESYLDDPEFANYTEQPANSGIPTVVVQPGNEGQVRDKRRSQLKKQAERRSMLFDAKNAGRLNFNGMGAGASNQRMSFLGGDLNNRRSFLALPSDVPMPPPPSVSRLNPKSSRNRDYRTSVLVSDDSDDELSKSRRPSGNDQGERNFNKPFSQPFQDQQQQQQQQYSYGFVQQQARQPNPVPANAEVNRVPSLTSSDIIRRKIAEQQAQAQAITSRMNELGQRDSQRGSLLTNITMQPWNEFEATSHIRMGSREQESAPEPPRQGPILQPPPRKFR